MAPAPRLRVDWARPCRLFDRRNEGEGRVRLKLHASHVRVTAGLREHIARRAYFCLSRFGERIADVTIRLSDENGPKRGVDRVCRVVTSIRGASSLVVEERDARITAAVDHALHRTACHVARVLRHCDQRAQGRLRGRGRPRARTFDPGLWAGGE